jgi:Caspase domain
VVRAAVALLLLIVVSAAARAEARFALLIGNQSYDPSVGVLRNPHNDIALVGDALKKQGFELLPPVKDGKRSAILGAVRDLVRRLNGSGSGAIGFIYYSGHGAAEKDTNINYLIPIDAKEPGTTAFWDESVKLDDVLRLLDGARSAAKFLVFDACRNELQLPSKDTSKGLIPVTEQQGMFIAYASAPGRTASDRGEKSGPYAAALAAELGNGGLDHLNLFQNVKEAVLGTTSGVQQPWESNGLGRRVYLTGPPTPAVDDPLSQPSSEAERAWRWVKDTNDNTELEAFLRRFGDTFYGDLAKSRLIEMRAKGRRKAKEETEAVQEEKRRPADDARRAVEGRLTAEQERLLQQRAELQQRSERDALQRAKDARKAKQNTSANAPQGERGRRADDERAAQSRLSAEQEELLKLRAELQERSEREALQRANEVAKRSTGSR